MPSDHPAQRLQRYFQGDTQAVEPLLLDWNYYQKIERLAQKNTQGTSLSWEDAAQEAKLKVLQAARNRKFRQGGVREFYRWAATVALYAIIDLIRKDKRLRGHWYWQSLEECIPGTDLPLGEAVADEFNLLESVEIADLVAKAREAVETVSLNFPKKQFEELWRGLVAGKTQCQLAAELGVSQTEVSKRRRELLAKVGNILGLLSVEKVEEELQRLHRGPRPKVSDQVKGPAISRSAK